MQIRTCSLQLNEHIPIDIGKRLADIEQNGWALWASFGFHPHFFRVSLRKIFAFLIRWFMFRQNIAR